MTNNTGNQKVETVKFEDMTTKETEEIGHRVFKTLKALRFNVPNYLMKFKPTNIERKCFNKHYSWNTEIRLSLDGDIN